MNTFVPTVSILKPQIVAHIGHKYQARLNLLEFQYLLNSQDSPANLRSEENKYYCMQFLPASSFSLSMISLCHLSYHRSFLVYHQKVLL